MPEMLTKAINVQQHIAQHSVGLPAALKVNNSTVVWQCCSIRWSPADSIMKSALLCSTKHNTTRMQAAGKAYMLQVAGYSSTQPPLLGAYMLLLCHTA
jgi:hypothetical protein